MNKEKVPQHIVIIPDGNRRWARDNNVSTEEGHMQGVQRVFDIIGRADKLGVECMTFWGFSTENWSRPEAEVKYLMDSIFLGSTLKYMEEFLTKDARFRLIGRRDRLPKGLVKKFEEIEQKTEGNSEKYVNIALDYGGRNEIVRAIKKAQEEGLEDITEDVIDSHLDTAGLPDVDLVIRTSGEQRLSGMVPWQSVYAELFFSKLKFPEFTADEFEKVVKNFGGRSRTFGGGK